MSEASKGPSMVPGNRTDYDEDTSASPNRDPARRLRERNYRRVNDPRTSPESEAPSGSREDG